MDGVAELGVEGVDAGVDVVLKELTESHPKGGGVGGGAEGEVEDFRGDALINPLDDGEIVLLPAWVMRGRRVIAGDVVKEGAAAEVDLE